MLCACRRFGAALRLRPASFCLVGSTSASCHTSPSGRGAAESSYGQWRAESRPKRMARYRRLWRPKPRAGMRLLEAAVLGLPNAGKSALTNRLIGADLCATASKPNTTRRNALAAYTAGEAQVLLHDTPGLMRSALQRKLGKVVAAEPHLVADSELAVSRSQMLVVVFDCADYQPVRPHGPALEQAEIHPRIYYLLYKYRPTPSVLVINKIDLLKDKHALIQLTARLATMHQDRGKATKMHWDTLDTTLQGEQDRFAVNEQYAWLLKKIMSKSLHHVQDAEIRRCFSADDASQRTLQPWPFFDRVFYVSATSGDGVQDLADYLVSRARPSPWRVAGWQRTSLSNKQIAVDAVRAAYMDALPNVVAYDMRFKLSHWDRCADSGLVRLVVACSCATVRQCSLAIGNSGAVVAHVTKQATQRIRNALQCDVYLKVAVVHRRPRRTAM